MPTTRKSRPRGEGADATLVTEEVAALFREGRMRLAAGDLDNAIRLLEESADLEGERTAPISRAQLVRLLVVRGELDLALEVLERATPKGAGVLWRTIGDLIAPLVAAERAQEAVACLVGAAESVRGEREFSAAFTSVLDLVQSVRISEQIDRRLLLTLKEAASERLDARLAVERLIAAREVAAGRGEQALLGLAELSAYALRREVRSVERDATTALMAVAIRHVDAAVDPPTELEPERCLYEHVNIDKLGHRLGARIGEVAALFEASCRLALERTRGDAAGVLGRVAAILRGRAGDIEQAKENLFSAPAESEGARGDRLTIAAWLEGIDPEPIAADEGTTTFPAVEGDVESGAEDAAEGDAQDGVEGAAESAVEGGAEDAAGDAGEGAAESAVEGGAERAPEGGAEDAAAGAAEGAAALSDATGGGSTLELPARLLVGIDDDAPAQSGGVVVALGGAPRLPEGVRWPRCRACGDALTFVAELRGAATQPSGHDRALLFACNVAPWNRKYQSRCDAGSDPGSGGTWVLVGADDPALPPRLAPAGTPVLGAEPLYLGSVEEDAAPTEETAAADKQATDAAAAPTVASAAPTVSAPGTEPATAVVSAPADEPGATAPPATGAVEDGDATAPPAEAAVAAETNEGSATAEEPARGVRSLGGPPPEGAPPCPGCGETLVHAMRIGGKGDPALQIANGGTLHVLLCPKGCERGVAFWRPGPA